MRLRLLVAVLCAASSLCGPMRADSLYPRTSGVSITQTGQVVTSDAAGFLVAYTFSATNTTSMTLGNVLFFTADESLNGDNATLTSPGDYTVAGTSYYADATDAAVFITPSETNASLDSRSSGSATIPEIPGFLISDLLAPGESTNFEIQFQLPTGISSFAGSAFVTADVVATPEPTSFALFSTGLLGIAGVVRKRFS